MYLDTVDPSRFRSFNISSTVVNTNKLLKLLAGRFHISQDYWWFFSAFYFSEAPKCLTSLKMTFQKIIFVIFYVYCYLYSKKKKLLKYTHAKLSFYMFFLEDTCKLLTVSL